MNAVMVKHRVHCVHYKRPLGFVLLHIYFKSLLCTRWKKKNWKKETCELHFNKWQENNKKNWMEGRMNLNIFNLFVLDLFDVAFALLSVFFLLTYSC